jgi:hypothetical protein
MVQLMPHDIFPFNPYVIYSIDHGIKYSAEIKAGEDKRKLSELLSEGKSIDEIISFVKTEDKKVSEYNLYENGINIFGYELMKEGKNEEALKIFKLNTELFPEEYNTWDSYGECL